MLTRTIIQRAVVLTALATSSFAALTQENAFGNWLKVANQPELEYRWRTQANSNGLPTSCELQVRGVNRDTTAQCVGKLEFATNAGSAIVRSIEVNIYPGRIVDNRLGPGCAGVTNLRISPRAIPR